MAEKLRFSTSKELEGWLKNKPADWARVIAWRAAMRVVPKLGVESRYMHSLDLYRNLLAVFRSLLVVILDRNEVSRNDLSKILISGRSYIKRHLFPQKGSKLAVVSGVNEAVYSAVDVALSSRWNSGFTVREAARSVQAAAYQFSTPGSASDVMIASSDDARILESGSGIKRIFREKLWNGDCPVWVLNGFTTMESSIELRKQNFTPWLDWYAALVPLDGSDRPRDIFGPELSKKIAVQSDEWWDRDVHEVNADIARWLDEKRKREASLVEDIAAVAGGIPQQAAGVYRFQWREGAVAPLPPDPARDADDAAILLGEARRKAVEFAKRLEGRNYEPRIARSVELVLEALPEDVPVNGLLLRSRTRTVEEDAARFANSSEVPEDVQSHLADLAGSLRDALTCFPKVREMEAESLALDLQSADVAGLVRHADAVLDAAREAPPYIIHPATVTALEEMAKTPEEPGTLPQSQSALRRLADRLVVVRNFLAVLARGVVTEVLDEVVEETRQAEEQWADTRPLLIDAVVEGGRVMNRTYLGHCAVSALVLAVCPTVQVLAAQCTIFVASSVLIGVARKHLKPPLDDSH